MIITKEQIKKILSIQNWKIFIFSIPSKLKSLIKFLIHLSGFMIVFIEFTIEKFIIFSKKIPFICRFSDKLIQIWETKFVKLLDKIIIKIDASSGFETRREYLISLAFESLAVKKSRSLITMFGMAIGVGVIVYLLSLGYGIERLIISQVAGLNELKIIDVAASQNTSLRMGPSSVNKISKLKGVESVVPFISTVGRVSYNKAQTDVLTYAIDKKYKELINLHLLKGTFFSPEYEKVSMNVYKASGVVAGKTTSLPTVYINQQIDSNLSSFYILPEIIVPVFEKCEVNANILGYTTRTESKYEGIRIWGESYAPFKGPGGSGINSNNEYMGKWIKGKYPLFIKRSDSTIIPAISEYGQQQWETGCIQEKYVHDIEKTITNEAVLGESTTSARLTTSVADTGVEATGSALPVYNTQVVSTDEAGIELVKLQASGSGQIISKKKSTETISFKKKPSSEIIVSTGLLKLLAIPIKSAIGKNLMVSYILTKSLMPEIEGKALTKQTKYKIIGIIENEQTIMYMPLYDLRSAGVLNSTQMKIILKNKSELKNVRKSIETLGFNTATVADTVTQIELLFNNVRLVLGLIGLIALGVASLGMFNTLTVSLLERTREIGGMKTIGMVSSEILDLFLAEALIMSIAGGFGGLLLGYVAGQITSSIISIIAISRGVGYISVSYIPGALYVFIILITFLVGIITGLYPAQRAKKISALNALRYE